MQVLFSQERVKVHEQSSERIELWVDEVIIEGRWGWGRLKPVINLVTGVNVQGTDKKIVFVISMIVVNV